MDAIIIEPKKLSGNVSISGSKNASLPIICASLLIDEVYLINVPKIKDIMLLIEILKKLNCIVYFKRNYLYINSKNIKYKPLFFEEVEKIRGSYYLIPIMLYLFHKCEIAMPGGCSFDKRPIDIHLELFNNLGYKVIENNNIISILLNEKIDKLEYCLKGLSVGASINAILISIAFEYIVLDGLNIEPEGRDLINFLRGIGFDVMCIGRRCITKKTIPNKLIYRYKIIPDRMEMMTFIAMGLLCGEITIKNIDINQIRYPLDVLKKSEYNISEKKNKIVVKRSRGKAFNIEASIYPFMPTDMQPILGILSMFSRGNGYIYDSIYPNRIQIYKELNSILDINIIGNKVYYVGNDYHININSIASDLRNAAGLFLYSLRCGGTIYNYKIIERGYEDFYKKIKKLGAKFTRVSKK